MMVVAKPRRWWYCSSPLCALVQGKAILTDTEDLVSDVVGLAASRRHSISGLKVIHSKAQQLGGWRVLSNTPMADILLFRQVRMLHRRSDIIPLPGSTSTKWSDKVASRCYTGDRHSYHSYRSVVFVRFAQQTSIRLSIARLYVASDFSSPLARLSKFQA